MQAGMVEIEITSAKTAEKRPLFRNKKNHPNPKARATSAMSLPPSLAKMSMSNINLCIQAVSIKQ